jgi:hypothetical protein
MTTTNTETAEDSSVNFGRPHLQPRSNSFPGSWPLIQERKIPIITHRVADNEAAGIPVSSMLPEPKHTLVKEEDREGKRDGFVCNDEHENYRPDPQNHRQHPQPMPVLLPPPPQHQQQQQFKPESTRRKVIRRTLFAMVVLIGNTLLSAYLKRFGVISKDLHEVVSERLAPVAEQVMPELQQRLEFLEMRMRDTLESVRYIAPSFNETLYWLRLNQTASPGSVSTQAKLRPGYLLAQQTRVQGKYPVVMVPGFVTSGLEVWKGKACMEKFFRERVWGGFASTQYWLRERYCVMENLALDPVHGGALTIGHLYTTNLYLLTSFSFSTCFRRSRGHQAQIGTGIPCRGLLCWKRLDVGQLLGLE